MAHEGAVSEASGPSGLLPNCGRGPHRRVSAARTARQSDRLVRGEEPADQRGSRSKGGVSDRDRGGGRYRLVMDREGE